MYKNKVKVICIASLTAVLVLGTAANAAGVTDGTSLSAGVASILDGVGNNTESQDGAATPEDGQSTATTEITEQAADTALSAGVEVVLDVASMESGELEAVDESEDEAGASYGYTNLGIANVEDHLNVRETPDDSSKLVGKMGNSSACEVLEIVGNKAHILSGSVEGYVSLDFLLTGDAAKERAASVIQKLATVNADGLKLRGAPGADSEVKGMVPYGEELVVLEELDGWVKVMYDTEQVYVSADYVTVDMKLKTALNMTEFLYGAGVSDVRVEMCEYAKQFIGNPYVWGGVSLTKGADCSGFTLSVMGKYGISLPHSAAAQSKMGTGVTVAEAKPGDLVFYAKGGRVNHVAIYIGGGQVLHASSPKTGIRTSGVYYRTPVAVRRFIQD